MDNATYQKVTDRIIAQMEAGTAPWVKPWADGGFPGRPLRADGTPYRGMNVVNLWCAAEERGFQSRCWLTYKKAQELGGQVKRGSKAELAFYVGKMVKEEEKASGETEERTISFLRAYAVFNADECDGLPSHFYAKAALLSNSPKEHIPAADVFISATGAKILYSGSRCFYRPSTDEIHMAPFENFHGNAAFYTTLFHELVHWSGASSRLDRQLKNGFGSPEYAMEELIAELGAAFCASDLNMAPEPRSDHAAYLSHWLKCLKADNRAIFKAAGLAEKACDYLRGASAVRE